MTIRNGNEAEKVATSGIPRRSARRCAAIALLGSGALGGLLTFGTLIVNGAGWAARVATGLTMPIGLIWLAFLSLAIWYWLLQQRSTAVVFLGLWLVIAITFNGRVANWYISNVEHPGVDLDSEDLFPLEAVVVLGGGASTNIQSVDELNRDGERVFSAAQAWHAGQCKWIISSDMPLPNRKSPDSVPRNLLQSVGVPPEVIIDIQGENTKGEMHSLRELMDDPQKELDGSGKMGLITSAFHMKRALRLAETQNLKFVPLPCAYRAGEHRPWSPRDFVPNAGAGVSFASALKEQLAWWVGR